MRKDFGAKPYIYPQPVLIIGSYDENNVPDAMNVAYAGIVNSDRIQINIGVRHKTADNIKLNKAFTVNVANVANMKAADYVGIVSAHNVPDKVKKAGISVFRSLIVDAPILENFPICLECLVEEIQQVGQTLRIVGKILNVAVEENVLGEDGEIDPSKVHALTFDPVHHYYMELGQVVGQAFEVGKELEKKENL